MIDCVTCATNNSCGITRGVEVDRLNAKNLGVLVHPDGVLRLVQQRVRVVVPEWVRIILDDDSKRVGKVYTLVAAEGIANLLCVRLLALGLSCRASAVGFAFDKVCGVLSVGLLGVGLEVWVMISQL
jgi:hypothetical protein